MPLFLYSGDQLVCHRWDGAPYCVTTKCAVRLCLRSPGRTRTAYQEVNRIVHVLDRGYIKLIDIVPHSEEQMHRTDPLPVPPHSHEHRPYDRCSLFVCDSGFGKNLQPIWRKLARRSPCYISSGLSPVCFEILANIRGPISSP
jgi:hypothetical protein